MNPAHTDCAQPGTLQLTRPPKKPDNCYFPDTIPTQWQSKGQEDAFPSAPRELLARPPIRFSGNFMLFRGAFSELLKQWQREIH